MAFTAGGFIYRNVEEQLSGKPLDVLKALYHAPRKTLTKNDLLKTFWTDSAVEDSTVSNAVSDARKALVRAMKRAGTKAPRGAKKTYPIMNVNRGGGDGEGSRTAWKLEDLP